MQIGITCVIPIRAPMRVRMGAPGRDHDRAKNVIIVTKLYEPPKCDDRHTFTDCAPLSNGGKLKPIKLYQLSIYIISLRKRYASVFFTFFKFFLRELLECSTLHDRVVLSLCYLYISKYLSIYIYMMCISQGNFFTLVKLLILKSFLTKFKKVVKKACKRNVDEYNSK